MCGRIAQSRAVADYLETIAWNSYSLPDALGPRYNVPPGTKPLTFHGLSGDSEVARLFWGYKPVGVQARTGEQRPPKHHP